MVCGTDGTVGVAATIELTWGLILALARQIPRHDAAIRAGDWQVGIGMLLRGRTLGLVGLGTLGAAMVPAARALGMAVTAWSRNLDPARAAQLGVEAPPRSESFRTADVISVHIKLGARSVGYLGRAELDMVQPSALLVNGPGAGMRHQDVPDRPVPTWTPPTYTVDFNGKVAGARPGEPHNWGRWGDADQRGCANLITEQSVLAGVAAVRTGRRFSLALPIGPPPTGAVPGAMMLRTATVGDAVLDPPSGHPAYSDEVLVMGTQSYTQLDGLAHVAHEDAMYNGYWAGLTTAASGASRLGIHQLADGIVGRGVLVDVSPRRPGSPPTRPAGSPTITLYWWGPRIRQSKRSTPRRPAGRSRCTSPRYATWAYRWPSCSAWTTWPPTAPPTGAGTSCSSRHPCPWWAASVPRSTR